MYIGDDATPASRCCAIQVVDDVNVQTVTPWPKPAEVKVNVFIFSTIVFGLASGSSDFF
jgi:hypothetical protein